MLSKQAVKAYLEADLSNFDWVKDLSDKELDAEVNSLGFNFQLPPFRHQKEMLLLGASLGDFLFFEDMGLGKTAVALHLADYFSSDGPALVLVQNILNLDNWVREVKVHVPHMSIIPLYGSSKERIKLLETTDADIYVINYAGLVAMMTERVEFNGKKKTVLDNHLIDEVARDFGTLIMDESHNLKNIQSLSYRVCNRMANSIPHRFGMTGTPFGRDIQDLWSQFYLVDRGATLGQTMGLFRAAYFNQKKNYWGGYEYQFKKSLETQLHERLKNASIRHDAAECGDLPKRIDTIFEVPFPSENYEYYLRVLSMVREAKGNVELMENAYHHMRQITSGFMTYKGEDNTKIEIDFGEKPKLDALMELVSELPPGRKMVVFHEYIYTGKIISDELKKAKVKHVRLYGATKDKPGTLKKFLDDPSVRLLVVNNESGGTGLNLQVANYMVIFELPRSPITHQQILKRLHRTGQERTVFVYYLIAQRSIDVKALSYLKEGKDLFDALIAGREEL